MLDIKYLSGRPDPAYASRQKMTTTGKIGSLGAGLLLGRDVGISHYYRRQGKKVWINGNGKNHTSRP